MYAIIRSGGKQHKVNEGDTLRVELLDAEEGATVEFDEVLAVGQGADMKVGAPTVADAKVTGTVVGHGRGRKVVVFRFKRRKGYQRKKGHRQGYTEIRIDSIAG